MKKVLAAVVCGMISLSVEGQLNKQLPPQQQIKGKRDIVCYSLPHDQHLVVDPPQAYIDWKDSKIAKTSTTTFEVTYIGFTPEAQAAFQKAVDIWSSLIESSVPIRVTAVWQAIGSAGVLGGASPGTYIRDFDGAQRILTWYPVALAEKMANQEFNDPEDPDVFAQFNSAYPSWSFDLNGTPQAGKTDFITVVLHEIGHGLGITRGYTVEGDNGNISSIFSGLHVIYDHFLENTGEQNLVANFPPPSAALKTQLTSGGIWFKSPQLTKGSTTDNRALVYAPNPFQAGSSIAHLDENTYNGSVNALMTPQIGTAEVVQNPGPVTMKILADQGWVHTRIVHTRLPNTENVTTPYEVKATILADTKDQTGAAYGYNSGEVKLNYTTDGATFTTLAMTPTGNPNEFSVNIPNTGSAVEYGYYITVKDNLNRIISKPGILAEDGEPPFNFYYFFEAGPDSQAPFINHTPPPFLQSDATELEVEAIISDNIGILEALVDYRINDVDQPAVPMTLVTDTDSTYFVAIALPVLQDGDKISYRIRAKDSSVAQNTAAKPSPTGFIDINVVSLAATQDSYSNDFNSASADFFGDTQFSIITPAGFSNGAIHTTHPYPAGTGSGFTSNFIYQLRIPIKLKSTEALLKFDEIVLVEPGEEGSVFGDDDFWDYVIVEGSKDGGSTWKPLVDGYDSRAQAVWLSKFNSSTDGGNPPNSNAAGDPTLFRTRTIDMLSNGNFVANDEIVIRFRLLTDQLVVGWGWAIDNLKIQIDDIPPVILHNHSDYLVLVSPTLSLPMKVTDAAGIDALEVDYKVNNGTIITEDLPVMDGTEQYTLEISFGGLVTTDKIEYRIRAKDKSGNETTLPAATFFQVPVVNFGAPMAQYSTDFNSGTGDFVGNFFSITQPSGFTNAAIQSTHPYPNGFGLTSNTSNYTYTLTKPITISASNPYMIFDEIAIVEYTGASVKDLVVVEGSKDNGVTWQTFLDPYSALAALPWKNAFDAGGSGNPSQYRSRLVNLTGSGKFAAGDNVIIRFRLTADGEKNGWGWAIDNLSIQGPVTGIEPTPGVSLIAYPNPIRNGSLKVSIQGEAGGNAQLQIINTQGRILVKESIQLLEEGLQREYPVDAWAQGMYLLRLVLADGGTITQKFVKADQ
ncbi:MAG: T9SS type A sorting domain-containing protein [Cyclobacteriaceae bacterium]|nr:T9SS type A sorting domain-containing protein [Cyclobacteriaceae bacterium]